MVLSEDDVRQFQGVIRKERSRSLRLGATIGTLVPLMLGLLGSYLWPAADPVLRWVNIMALVTLAVLAALQVGIMIGDSYRRPHLEIGIGVMPAPPDEPRGRDFRVK